MKNFKIVLFSGFGFLAFNFGVAKAACTPQCLNPPPFTDHCCFYICNDSDVDMSYLLTPSSEPEPDYDLLPKKQQKTFSWRMLQPCPKIDVKVGDKDVQHYKGEVPSWGGLKCNYKVGDWGVSCSTLTAKKPVRR